MERRSSVKLSQKLYSLAHSSEAADLIPYSLEEARRCGESVISWKLRVKNLGLDMLDPAVGLIGAKPSLAERIQERLGTRTIAEDEQAREAWGQVLALNRSRGKLSRPIPVAWDFVEDELRKEAAIFPGSDDDIPF